MPFKDDEEEERFLRELFAKDAPKPQAQPAHQWIPNHLTVFAIGILLMIGFHGQDLVVTVIGLVLLVYDVVLYRQVSVEQKNKKNFEQSFKQ